MKSTKFTCIALDRLCDHLGVEFDACPASGKGHVTMDLSSRLPDKYKDDEWMCDGFRYTGSKKYVLARLVMLAIEEPSVGFAMTKPEVRDAILLRRVESDSGLAGHEWKALTSVTMEVCDAVS